MGLKEEMEKERARALEKEYRIRVKESDRLLIIKALAKSLKAGLLDFRNKNAALLEEYNDAAKALIWLGQYEVRKKIEAANKGVLEELGALYLLMQRLARPGRGRKGVRASDPIWDFTSNKMLEECDKILRGEELGYYI